MCRRLGRKHRDWWAPDPCKTYRQHLSMAIIGESIRVNQYHHLNAPYIRLKAVTLKRFSF